jgi:hypothetical protein
VPRIKYSNRPEQAPLFGRIAQIALFGTVQDAALPVHTAKTDQLTQKNRSIDSKCRSVLGFASTVWRPGW